MDKTEYKVKLEEISRLAEEGCFSEAAQMAGEIDWRHIKSLRTLSMIGEIYEADKQYEKSKSIMALAYKRSGTSKTVLYRLSELSIRTGEYAEAKRYINEFEQISPNDTSRYLLKYKLLRAQKAPYDDQIDVLREYKDHEYSERWAYELAKVYKKNGQKDKCVEECDDMILWFSEGRYVRKALELKRTIQELTPSQTTLLERLLAEEADARNSRISPSAEEEQDRQLGALEVVEKAVLHADEEDETKEYSSSNERGHRETEEAYTGETELPEEEEGRPEEDDQDDGKEAGEDRFREFTEENDLHDPSEADEAEEADGEFEDPADRSPLNELKNLTQRAEQEETFQMKVTSQINDFVNKFSDFRFRNPFRKKENQEEDAEQETYSAFGESKVQPAQEEPLEGNASATEENPAAAEALDASPAEKTEAGSGAVAAGEKKEDGFDLESLFAETAGFFASEVASGGYVLADTLEDDREAAEAEAFRRRADRMEELAKASAKESSDELESLLKEEISLITESLAASEAENTGTEEAAADDAAEAAGPETSALEEAVSVDTEGTVDAVLSGETEVPEEEGTVPEDAISEEVPADAEVPEEESPEEESPEEESPEEESPEEESPEEESPEEESPEVENPEEESPEEEIFEEAVSEEELFEEEFPEEELPEEDTADEAPEEGLPESSAGFFGRVRAFSSGLKTKLFAKTKAPSEEEPEAEEAPALGEENAEAEEAVEASAQPEEKAPEFNMAEVLGAIDTDTVREMLEAESGAAEFEETADFSDEAEDEEIRIYEVGADRNQEELPEEIPDVEFEAVRAEAPAVPDEDRVQDGIPADDEDPDEIPQEETPEDTLDSDEAGRATVTKEEIAEHLIITKDYLTKVPVEGRMFNAEEKKLMSYFAGIPGIDQQVTAAVADIHNNSGDRSSKSGNVLIMGRQGSGKTRLANALRELVCIDLGVSAIKSATILPEKFEERHPAEIVKKMAGGYLVIEAAGSMNDEDVEALNEAMEYRTDALIVVLEDEKADLMNLLDRHPDFARKFTSTIMIPIFTNDELVQFGSLYARESGYCLDEMATLALYQTIGENQKDSEPVTIAIVRAIVDRAISRSSRKFRIGKPEKSGGLIVLHEKDFNF